MSKKELEVTLDFSRKVRFAAGRIDLAEQEERAMAVENPKMDEIQRKRRRFHEILKELSEGKQLKDILTKEEYDAYPDDEKEMAKTEY